MKYRLLIVIASVVILNACSERTQVATTLPTLVASSTETTEPSPTIPPGTQLPFNLSTPAIVIENPGPEDTPAATPTQIPLSSEKLTILRPADGSMITSPVRVVGQAGPAYLNRIEIRLIGEDGRLITTHYDYLYALPGNLGPYNTVFEFITPHLAEAARLEVRNYDPIDGNLNHLTSVDVTLLSIGSPRTHHTIHGPEKIKIDSPTENDIIDGNSLIVSGIGWPDTDNPLHVEIINSVGDVIGSGLFKFKPHEIGIAAPFQIELAYEVDSFQVARIAVFEDSDSIPGILHYTSIIVRLRP
jgi:hypothetical protein